MTCPTCGKAMLTERPHAHPVTVDSKRVTRDQLAAGIQEAYEAGQDPDEAADRWWAALASSPASEPEGLDVERLGRAWDECGYSPKVADEEWVALAAEYDRLDRP